jgi:hypothetical protein
MEKRYSKRAASAGLLRLVFVSTVAGPILAGCTDDEDLKKEAVQEARAACNVGRSAMVIMPNKLNGSETVIVLKMFMSKNNREFRCVKRFRSKLGYSFHPISIGDSPEAPE